jgi:hypothetical protein
MEMLNHHLGADSFIHKGIRPAIKRVEFIIDRMFVTLRDRGWAIIVLNVHATTDDKNIVKNDSFMRNGIVIGSVPEVQHENVVRIFQYNGKDEDIFKPTIGNESLHEINNNNNNNNH